MLLLLLMPGLDKTTLLFKAPKRKGRTVEQAKVIATFWVRSLQKLVNSLNAVGRLVNGTEPTITLSHAQLRLRQKMEKSGVCPGCLLVVEVLDVRGVVCER